MNHSTLQDKRPVQKLNHVYEQHVDNASFLWVLRSHAVRQPHYTAADIKELEQRIDAHLDALMLSIEQSWEYCLQALALEEPGEAFTTAVIAFRSHDTQKIQRAVDAGLKNNATFNGLVSALGWLPSNLAHPWIKKFLSSKDINHKYLAIAACSIRREDPGTYLEKFLQREDCQAHVQLYARCLRLVGELRRQDLMPALNQAMSVDEAQVCFWANWSAILLGNKAMVNNLKSFVLQAGPFQDKAIQLAFRVLPVEHARAWVATLLEDKSQIRCVIKAIGVLGDPHAVNWLIQQMDQPGIARVSAEAFTMITGIDLEQNQLSRENPEQHTLPNDDPNDDDVAMDEDENLLWPDAAKVARIWQQRGNRFSVGERYFMGQAIQHEHLIEQFDKAYQRQRYAAGIELTLNGTARLLPNVEAKQGS